MHQSLARYSAPVSLVHAPSWADFITTMVGFKVFGTHNGRGSLGPMANAPFPIPAHQTGRADFRHPAFRPASPQGTRRDRSGQALKAQNAEFSMNDIERESAIAAPLHLVSSREEPAQTFKDILIDATVCLAPRAVAKVVGPASQ